MPRRDSNSCVKAVSASAGTRQTSQPGKNDPRMSIAGAREHPAWNKEARRSEPPYMANWRVLLATISGPLRLGLHRIPGSERKVHQSRKHLCPGKYVRRAGLRQGSLRRRHVQ